MVTFFRGILNSLLNFPKSSHRLYHRLSHPSPRRWTWWRIDTYSSFYLQSQSDASPVRCESVRPSSFAAQKIQRFWMKFVQRCDFVPVNISGGILNPIGSMVLHDIFTYTFIIKINYMWVNLGNFQIIRKYEFPLFRIGRGPSWHPELRLFLFWGGHSLTQPPFNGPTGGLVVIICPVLLWCFFTSIEHLDKKHTL